MERSGTGLRLAFWNSKCDCFMYAVCCDISSELDCRETAGENCIGQAKVTDYPYSNSPSSVREKSKYTAAMLQASKMSCCGWIDTQDVEK